MKEKKKRGTCGTLLIVFIVIAILGIFVPDNKEKEKPEQEPQEIVEQTINETQDDQPSAPAAEEVTVAAEETETKEDPKVELQNELKDKYGFIPAGSVRNDTTGNWRLTRYNSSAPVDEFIIDYYKAFFESDDEIHFLVNYTLNTTTVVRCSLSNYMLSYEIHERVEDEEHDAKTIGNGMLLESYLAYVESGEVEKIDTTVE